MSARISEFLVGDLPLAMRRELDPHVASCARCRAELAACSSLVAELRALPVSASIARSWIGVGRALDAERRERPLPWLTQVLALAACALLLAVPLVRHSAEFASRLAAPASVQPWLLPGVFVLFGAMTAFAALPLLATAGRPLLVRRTGSSIAP